jgi:hypothetical protein
MPGTQTAWTTAAIQNQWFWRAVLVRLPSARSLLRGRELGISTWAVMCQPSPNKGRAAVSTAPFAEAAEAANICSETSVS